MNTFLNRAFIQAIYLKIAADVRQYPTVEAYLKENTDEFIGFAELFSHVNPLVLRTLLPN
jgi:hypothetical protein